MEYQRSSVNRVRQHALGRPAWVAPLLLGMGAAAFGVLTDCGRTLPGAPTISRSEAGDASDASLELDGPVELDAPAEPDAPSGGRCGSSPTLMDDFVRHVPETQDPVGVQMPGIFVGGTELYYVLNWDSNGGGSHGLLMRVPTRGGSAVQMASIPGGGGQGAQPLAVTPKAIVFSEALGDKGGPGAIASIPRGGGSVTILASTQGSALALVADADRAYFVDDEGTKSVPLAGGPVRRLTSSRADSLGVIGNKLYLTEVPQGALSSLPLGGGALTVLAAGETGALYPIACGPDLCWMNEKSFMDAALERLAPGGAPVVVAESGALAEFYALVFDGQNFFVTAGAGGASVSRIPWTGGTVDFVWGDMGTTGLALDENCLYWSSSRGIFSLALSAADVAGAGSE